MGQTLQQSRMAGKSSNTSMDFHELSRIFLHFIWVVFPYLSHDFPIESFIFHSQEEEPVPRLCVVDEAQGYCAGDVDGILICAVNV